MASAIASTIYTVPMHYIYTCVCKYCIQCNILELFIMVINNSKSVTIAVLLIHICIHIE